MDPLLHIVIFADRETDDPQIAAARLPFSGFQLVLEGLDLTEQ
jgi:hypothetical protein